MTNEPPTYTQLTDKTRELLNENQTAPVAEIQEELPRLTNALETAHIELEAKNDELRQTMQNTEASRRELLDLYESAPVAYVSLEPKGIVTRANAMARSLLGSDSVGRSFNRFIMEEDWNDWHYSLKDGAAQNKRIRLDLRLIRPSDSPVIVEIHARPFFVTRDQLEGWHVALVDVTDQRCSERRLKRLNEQLEMAADAARLGIWSYRLNDQTWRTSWNNQLYRLLGLEVGGGQENGHRFFEFIHPEDRKGSLMNLDALLSGTENEIREEFRIVRPDGAVRWLASRGRVYRDVHGEPTHICGINCDITERKEEEKKKDRKHVQQSTSLKETRRLNEELSQYAYAISHDLKEPMRAIRNYSDFLVEDLAGRLEDEQKTYIDGLQQAVDQGTRLIDDLLDFSRIDRKAEGKETVDLDELIQRIRSVLDPEERVNFQITAPLPTIDSNRPLLRQIFQNLLSNAVKFNHRESKTVTVGCRTAPEDHIDIFVRDNGIGIETEYHEKIFRIFQRLHTQSEFPGTGIGLAIVHKAVKLLNGELHLESELGKGSTFTVRLPRQ